MYLLFLNNTLPYQIDLNKLRHQMLILLCQNHSGTYIYFVAPVYLNGNIIWTHLFSLSRFIPSLPCYPIRLILSGPIGYHLFLNQKQLIIQIDSLCNISYQNIIDLALQSNPTNPYFMADLYQNIVNRFHNNLDCRSPDDMLDALWCHLKT